MDAAAGKLPGIKKDKPHCSMCKTNTSKTTFFSDTGQVLCENCLNTKLRQDCGDSVKRSQKKSNRKCRCVKSKKSGLETLKKNYSDHGTDTNEDNKTRSHTEVKIKYKNEDYHDSLSSNNSAFLYLQPLNNVNKTSEYAPLSRPITCPVCSKMITINSVKLHFYFDHSKVPRLVFSSSVPKYILSKATDFGLETKCLTVLLLEWNEKQDLNTDKKYLRVVRSTNNFRNKSVLLMGAKISHDISSQTNKENSRALEVVKKQHGDMITHFNDEDNIMLWICKLEDDEINYKITLTKEDTKFSFSYTGEAIHIKDKQDAQTMYQDTNCLNLKGKAVNRLIDNRGQIHVVVNLRYLE